MKIWYLNYLPNYRSTLTQKYKIVGQRKVVLTIITKEQIEHFGGAGFSSNWCNGLKPNFVRGQYE
jgi:hypothetical protein